MGSNARDASNYTSVPWVNAPAFPYLEDPSAGVAVLPSVEQPWADVQDLTLYQAVNSAPNPDVVQQFPMALQNSMAQPASTSQQIMSLEDSRLPDEQSDPSGRSVIKQANWPLEPTKDDWEEHRLQITDLYRDNPLKDVMDIMKREHGIKASAKMYKDRINKWKIDKKIKGEEMKAIIRKRAQRSRAGKKSAFRIRDSQVSQIKIVRYRKAKGLSSEEQALRLRAPMPAELFCYTPLLSPLSTPQVLETPERIVRLVQEYINGSFDSGTWLTTEDQICISRKGSNSLIYNFQVRFEHATRMIRSGEPKDGWQLLNMAMALIEQILSVESPEILPRLAFLIRDPFSLNHFAEIASTLLRQFSALSAAIMPQMHSFNHIFALLIGLETSHLEETLGMVMQSQVDCFARRSGRYSWSTLELQLSMLPGEPTAKAAQTTEHCLTLLRECETNLGTFDERSLEVRLSLACQHFHQSEFQETAELAQTIISLAAQNQDHVTPLISNTFFALSWAQFELSKLELAEQNIRQAIHIRILDHGWEDDRVHHFMLHLESWLKEWNRPDEAAEVRRQSEEIIGSKLERLNREEEERYRRCQVSEV